MSKSKTTKYIYESFGELINFALHNGFKPNIQEWNSTNTQELEAEAIEFLEESNFKIDFTNRSTKTIKTAQSKIAEYWNDGIPSQSWSGNFRTDGLILYSFNLPIGTTDRNGKKIVFTYLKSAGHFISGSTAKHVGLAKKVTVFLREPQNIVIETKVAK